MRYAIRWFKCKLKPPNKVWCDTIMIKGIASMWSVKITVMYADTFYKVPYHHELASSLADIVLLFNGNYVNGHYCATLKVRGDNFVIGSHMQEKGIVGMMIAWRGRVVGITNGQRKERYQWSVCHWNHLMNSSPNTMKVR